MVVEHYWRKINNLIVGRFVGLVDVLRFGKISTETIFQTIFNGYENTEWKIGSGTEKWQKTCPNNLRFI